MSKGISLHIGVNRVDPEKYTLAPTHAGWECMVVTDEYEPVRFKGNFRIGWEGPLTSCEFDAEDLAEIASSQNFDVTILRTEQATTENVISEIRAAARRLKSGDTFLLTYAGHGSQVEDLSADEWDGADETWCLFDRMFLDDEQRTLYAEFARGVNLVVFSDSCHSGTATRAANFETPAYSDRHRGRRAMEERTAKALYEGNRKLYDAIQRGLPSPQPKLKANRILFAACQDHEHAHGDDENGVFTRALKNVWNGGKFEGGYEDFAKGIRDELQSQYNKAVDAAGGDASAVKLQIPNFVRVKGSSKASLAKLVKKKPFSV